MKLFPFCGLLVLLAASGVAAERQTLRGHVPSVVANLQPKSRLAAAARLNLAIGLPLRNPEALKNLLQQIYDPSNPNFRHYLTTEQFTEMFGPTKEEYQALINFAEDNGLKVTATHPNRVVLDVSGAVIDIEKAFNVTMRVYQHPQEARTFYAPDVEPSLDSPVRVLRISGLDDYWIPKPQHKVKPVNFAAKVTPNGGSGPGGSYRGNDFRAAYVPGTPLTGSGQTVGLLQFDGFYANDIATYVSQAGLPTIPITVVPINGGVSTPGGGNGEVALDIEMVMSMAPGISRIYVYEAPNPSPWVSLLSRMANDDLSKQLSCSWGGGPPDATAEQIFQQMAAQGQSFFNASGDSDAFTSAIDFPADSPNITQVGGTTLTTTGPGGAYVSETAWNWGLVNGKYVGTSGGVSTFYAIPNYQQGINMSTNLGSTTMRNVPDVALTGDDVYVVYNNGSSGVFGGTSCAAPLWAGFMAMVNQQAALAASPPIGFLNPAVYGIGKTNSSYATIFHDTTTGNNFSAQSPTKYPAVPGYDLCTGWGTPNGTNMINSLAPLVFRPVLNNAGFTLTAEGCLLANGVIDPGETVTVNLALQNVGNANTASLLVTLLATNGVTTPSVAQNYGTIVAGSSAVTRSFSFTASGTCGGTIVPTFQIQNSFTNFGDMTVTQQLGATIVTTVFGTNATAFNIPGSHNSGPASIFPSIISVSGVTDIVSKVTVTLRGLTHSAPDDIDVLLVSPAGQKILLMSDAGGRGDINNVTLTFDDSAVSTIPDSGQITSGTWQPANYGSGDSFASPAPDGPYGDTLSALIGQNPNGNWSLYIQDDQNPNTGDLAQGWSLAISTSHPVCCNGGVTLAANLAIGQTVSPTQLNVGSNLTFTLSVTNFGPDSASGATITDILPAGISFVSANTTQGAISNDTGTVFCSLGTMANGGVATVTINATATTAGVRTNSASVNSGASDPNSANNTAFGIFSVNSFPTISAITNRTINEDTTTGVIAFTIGDAETLSSSLTLSKTSSDTNLVPLANVVFGGSGSDRTVTVTPTTNASGSATIGITVSDGMASATSSFVLTVTPVNDPPVLAAIADRVVHAGTLIQFTNVASDSDLPPDALTFSLQPGAPAAASVNPTSGIFSWLTSDADAGTTNDITVTVTDDGSPTLSANQTFTATVVSRPIIQTVDISNSFVTLTWNSISGQTYRVQTKLDLDVTAWSNVPPDVIATGTNASMTTPLVSPSQSFYRVLVP